MRTLKQLYGKDNSHRMVTVYGYDENQGVELFDILYVTGTSSMTVESMWTAFGQGGITSALSVGGTEHWYRNLTKDECKARLNVIGKAAEKAGCKNYGGWEDRR